MHLVKDARVCRADRREHRARVSPEQRDCRFLHPTPSAYSPTSIPAIMQSTSNVWSAETSELSACLERISSGRTVPVSTYRLQLNNRFHFEDARKLVPYLCRLGITHLYSSPILMAREGSQHGYDIIDHSQ